ncbi:hypothetical protein E6W17_01875 [Streptomyces sp. A1547]|nr:hypothetical protein E6W17_01875 [Streptomyces sp. A1547]
MLDDQLIGQLADRAKADGTNLTGQGGLRALGPGHGPPARQSAGHPQTSTAPAQSARQTRPRSSSC